MSDTIMEKSPKMAKAKENGPKMPKPKKDSLLHPSNKAELERSMAKHQEEMNEYLEKAAQAKNTKMMTTEKYNQIVKFINEPEVEGDELGLDKSQFSKFKHTVNKKKEYEIVSCAILQVNKALCVPAPKEVSVFVQ